VTPALNELKAIQHWEVDTTDPNKILTIQAENNLTSIEVIDALKQKGYNAQSIT
jgi:copper chaperone